jgi:uncharacterized membrane protein YjdF
MHFLGGLVLGVIVIAILNRREKSFKSFLIILFCVLALGGAWEFFEYTYGLTQSTEGYTIDTIHDFLMDGLGAIVAYCSTILLTRQS